MDERSVAFEVAAEPLVEYLLKLSVNDPAHKFVLADLYDMINERRDEEIAELQGTIFGLRTSTDFYHDPIKRHRLVVLQDRIRQLQGASNG